MSSLCVVYILVSVRFAIRHDAKLAEAVVCYCFCDLLPAAPVSFTNGPVVQISEHQFGSAVLTLSFNSNVNPIPQTSGIMWRDPSNNIVTASARHALSMNNAVLTITRADVTDDGLYTASVTNGIGSTAMITFNVTIFSKSY